MIFITIGPNGCTVATYAEILAYLRDQMRSIYGSDIYIDDDSQDGQWLAVIALLISDLLNAVQAAYNSFSPASAQGVGLSTVVKINGIRRLVSSSSSVLVTIGGTVGTEINWGQVEDTFGVRWALPALVVIPADGLVDVTATCVTPGAVKASIGTITKIVTPVRGWQTVTNPDAATPGAPVESDAALRVRQSQSTALPALTILAAIQGAILNLPGVQRALVYENDTSATDADGIPEHSVSAVVEGGIAQDIGQTICNKKSPGTGTYGTTSVDCVDPGGLPVVIDFFILDVQEINLIVKLTALSGYLASTGDLIELTLVEWMNLLKIGEDSVLNRLWAPVDLSGNAATTATGLSQTVLDGLSDTYKATAIYQALPNMVIEGGPYAAADTTVDITNPDNYTNGDKIGLVLDNGAVHYTTVSNKVGNTITMAAGIPGGRTAQNGALMYVANDLTILFNQAAATTVAKIDLQVT